VLPEAVFATVEATDGTPHEAPGMHRKHYSPRHARVLIVRSGEMPPVDAAYVWHHVEQPDPTIAVHMPSDPEAYAARIYAVLHDLDARGVHTIAIESLPEDAAWDALRDRLRRSAAE
jgi:L-threonylcarbamoyladenylate synthase